MGRLKLDMSDKIDSNGDLSTYLTEGLRSVPEKFDV